MRTVEQSNLALVVRLLALSDEHVQASFLCREFSTQFFDAHVGWLLDNPQVENLSLYNKVVLIADFLLDVCNLLAWESRNDAVNEGSANIVVLRTTP